MPLLRHYLKLSPGLQEYVAHIDPKASNWEQDIFKDITENGTLLVIESLPPTGQGDRIGLCGDKYYCEAGKDWDRHDSLFVYKVEAAIRRQPKTIPHRYPAQLYILEVKFAASLDPITAIWSSAPPQAGSGIGIDASVETGPLESAPSEHLLKLLTNVPSDLRSSWLPRSQAVDYGKADQFIEALRKPWAKFQLGKYTSLSTRQESLLKGLIPNPQLGNKERGRLLSLFDVSLLNAYARESDAREAILFIARIFHLAAT